MTAIGHILLAEQRIPSTPCMGLGGHEGARFDHSRLKMKGATYDLAIEYPRDERAKKPMVVAGCWLSRSVVIRRGDLLAVATRWLG